MRLPIYSTAWLAISITAAIAGCTEEGGNWYCDQVDGITYTNFGSQGTYQKVASMANGKCGSSPQSYLGGMSPLDGEISWHFRGPMRLKQFAYYTLGTSEKRDNTFTRRARTHGHGGHKHWHDRSVGQLQRRAALDDNAPQNSPRDTWHDLSVAEQQERDYLERRDSPKMATATIDGKIVSWAIDAANSIVAPLTSAGTAAPAVATIHMNPEPAHVNAGAGKWGRQAYYNAEQQTAAGLVFLNHKGGQGSGVFDYTWGNSLSYANADAQSGSTTPQTLADALLPDNTEIAVFSSRMCNDTSCGTVRPGTVAHHGFDGPTKLFLLEFSMPLSNARTGLNADMPAAWILNAQIPRTMQYGPAECSCWSTGCGEWDIFEVLDAGNAKCKSTFHGAKASSGGDSNWFARPTGKTVRVAVLFDGADKAARGRGVITVLPDDFVFDEKVDVAKIEEVVGTVDPVRRRKFVLPN